MTTPLHLTDVARYLRVERAAAPVVAQRFTFHDLRGHYTTYFKLRFGELPELHANPATTAGVYERSKVVSRKAL